MPNKERIISQLQMIVTELSQQALGHNIQSKIFKSKGFAKLAEKYAEHFKEEMGYVDRCVDRIIDLGGQVKNEAKKETKVYEDVVEWLKYDLQVSKNGLELLSTIIKECEDDISTYDLLRDYYKDEEEDMYWSQGQLELIEAIGLQNWLVQQL